MSNDAPNPKALLAKAAECIDALLFEQDTDEVCRFDEYRLCMTHGHHAPCPVPPAVELLRVLRVAQPESGEIPRITAEERDLALARFILKEVNRVGYTGEHSLIQAFERSQNAAQFGGAPPSEGKDLKMSIPRIEYENNGREVWHSDDRYPMKHLPDWLTIEDGSTLGLYECTHCGVQVFAGLDARRNVVVRAATPQSEEEQPR